MVFQKYVNDQSTNKLMDLLITFGILKHILVNKVHFWIPTDMDGAGQDHVLYYLQVE